MSEWISVKDKLPDDDQDVLLATETVGTYGRDETMENKRRSVCFGYCDCGDWVVNRYDCGGEYIREINERYQWMVVTVTHWMPLPELPEENHNG